MTVNERVGVVIILLMSWAASASAQTGIGLIVRPWPEGSQSQLHTDAILINRGHTNNSDARFRLQRYDAIGRWRSGEGGDHTLSVGFDTTYLNLSTSDPALPDRLVDQSVAAGFLLSDPGQHASLWLTLGVGYAGNNPYADGDAVYGQVNLIYTQPIDASSSWQWVLNYNGNRTIFPDTPLPAVAYQRRVSDHLSYSLGLPVSSVVWQPTERVTVRVAGIPPVNVTAVVEYELSSGWRLFGEYSGTTEAFTIDGGRDNRRLFFEQSRLEVGIRLRTDQRVDVTLAGGYAFSQEFSQGFDVLDLDDVAEVSDEPYFRVAMNFRF